MPRVEECKISLSPRNPEYMYKPKLPLLSMIMLTMRKSKEKKKQNA